MKKLNLKNKEIDKNFYGTEKNYKKINVSVDLI